MFDPNGVFAELELGVPGSAELQLGMNTGGVFIPHWCFDSHADRVASRAIRL
ncbi:MAG TPA: hypothetical protein VHD62_17855 [Opitutaceae bacterium]|nr:hypothetical protein [Opitutaceae bacterium]